MAGLKGRSGGHNRKPTHLKLIEGTLGRNPQRANKREPKATTDVKRKLRAPAWSGKLTRKWFRYFQREVNTLGVLGDTDEAALQGLAMAAAELEVAWREIQQRGYTYEVVDEKGNVTIRPRPEVAIATRARKEMKQWFALFGLSPADRARVQVGKEPEDPFEAFMRRGKA
ncbi:MAG TPA: phage terminase small subunit P27 family [Dehalococcoidia bacterium]|nr:phage terminase small subunit P27 family [Dehalococcoidia bacterium]